MSSTTDELRTCYKCDYETTEQVAKCPRCGQRMRTARQVRRLGWVLTFLGAFLVIFMGAITVLVTNIISQANDPHATTKFTGGPEMLLFMYGLFGFVILFGLVAMTGGIWQIKYGKRNKKLAYIVLAMGLIFVIIGWLVRIFRA
jgi:hypothetical protein